MKIKQLLIIILIIFLLAVAYAQSGISFKQPTNSGETASEKARYTKITAAEAYEIINGSNPYLLLDVRTKAEYNYQRFIGALNIPIGELEEKAERLLPNKDLTILVYCQRGNRSKSASQLLIKLGYINTYDIGGIEQWPYSYLLEMAE